jgi:type VI protein secretion system component VasK
MQLKLNPKKAAVKATKASSKPVQLNIEIKAAIDSYLRASGSSLFNRNRQLYTRPWFLVLGPGESGKSTLFSSPVITPQFSYPGESEGHVSGTSAPSLQWRFCDEAVWIDVSGKVFDNNESEEFDSILSSLKSLRPKSPVDGIILVIDIDKLQNSDQNGAKEIGGALRKQIDILIKNWGIELPVFLILSNTDKIIGFNEIFCDPSGKWNECSLGAIIPENDSLLPRHIFLQEFRDMVHSLKSIRLKMLAREKDQQKRNLICRFPVSMESIREKLGTLIAMLFKPSTFTGKPLFAGFFFTSCQDIKSDKSLLSESSFDLGNTLASHPLNINKEHQGTKGKGPFSKTITYFARPLFTSIIPQQSFASNKTRLRRIKDTRNSLVWISSAAVACSLILWLVWGAFFNVRSFDNRAKKIAAVPVDQSLEGIMNLGRLSDMYHLTKKYAENHRSIPMILTGYNAHRMHESISKIYFEHIRRNIALPCSTILVDSIQTMIGYDNSSPLNNFSALKGSLQALIHISKARKTYGDLLLSPADTQHITSVLFNDVQKAYGIKAENEIAQNLKKVVHDYVDMIAHDQYGSLLALGPDTLYPRLVKQAQQKLVDLFNYEAVYSSTIRRCIDESKELYLTDILPDAGTALVSKKPLSEIFTPQGWKKIVNPTLDNDSRRLNKVEKWVKGDNEINVSGANRDELYSFLVKRYLEDVNTAWRDFLSSLDPGVFGSISDAKDVMMQLGNQKSIMALTITKFSEWSQQFTISDTSVADVNHQLDTFRSSLLFLGEFVSGGFPQYQNMLKTIAEGLAKVESGKKISSIFNGTVDDPLAIAYQNTGAALLSSLPDDGRAMLKGVLFLILDKCISVLESSLKTEVNSIWSAQVYSPYATQFANRYPFVSDRHNSDAAFDATIDFFNPEKGSFWQTYSTYLAPYIKETDGKFSPRVVKGMVTPDFSQGFMTCLEKAKRITTVFYRENEKKSWKISITPRPSSIAGAIIQVGKISSDVLLNRAQFQWPINDENITMSFDFTDKNGNRCPKYYKTQWDLMYLMNMWVNRDNLSLTRDVFGATIDLTSSGGYHFLLPSKIQVFDPNNPFYENVFRGFVVPEKIVQ